ncbi:MAG: 50S ribosomal protein L2 [Candidatus Muirbacterium halophilum]|nr:50S ribosomal protein L2 [Candidatus Muirbacterium halophilum]MCK9475253.1 50S ribosomal protein L2 [Candidatus Muirbacterium halophilum]
MAIKRFKPKTPSRRFMAIIDRSDLSKVEPESSLLVPLKKTGGRNNAGRITSRFRGGGHKRAYRIIDFKRDKIDVPGTVKTMEYDPNRTANIALIFYADGEKRYILAPDGLKIGDVILSADRVEIKPGNTTKLKNMPSGTHVHNIEMKPGKGGQIARSAGSSAQVLSVEGKYALLKMPSGEIRKIFAECKATVGNVGNSDWMNQTIGKAGRVRWIGRKPHVRGVAMNPVDHPHGGGEGKAPAGNPHPVSPWGQCAKGLKTRKAKPSDKFIVKRIN